ncbi:hypothetical protein FRB99_004219 [Tulasnella sp. 403]|nr:hypothetical protein FRB99_004219 [Tulasnella sp. 403]
MFANEWPAPRWQPGTPPENGCLTDPESVRTPTNPRYPTPPPTEKTKKHRPKPSSHSTAQQRVLAADESFIPVAPESAWKKGHIEVVDYKDGRLWGLLGPPDGYLTWGANQFTGIAGRSSGILVEIP